MSTDQYQLPCPQCNQAILVSGRQAGQEVTCSNCSTTTQAPRLGELKKLEMLVQSGGDRGRKPTQGNRLFALGLLLLTLFGALGGGLHYYAQSIIVDFDVEAALDEMDPLVNQMKPSEVVFVFNQMEVGKGLPPWQEPPHVAATKQGNILKYFSYAFFGIGGIGALIMAIGLVSRRK